MSLPLPDQVFLGLTIEYLEFGSLEQIDAIRTISTFVKEGKLSFYFDQDTTGFEASLEDKLVFVPPFGEGDPDMTEPPEYNLLSGEKAVSYPFNIIRQDQLNLCQNKLYDVEQAEEQFTQAHYNPGCDAPALPTLGHYMCTSCNELTCNTRFIEVMYFESEGKIYRTYDPVENNRISVYVEVGNIYFKKRELEYFKLELDKSSKKRKSEKLQPAEKALALIARKLANDKSNFRTGTKVNSSTFKNYVIDLASDYEVSDHGLKSIDEVLNAALKELDLKELKDFPK
jgi:hypothetical protein